MTEPKHIPLTENTRKWIDWLFDTLPHPVRKALEAYDEAHDVEDED
jgi:hypothetical protein